MAVPYQLRFIIPVRPLLPGCDFERLVPFRPEPAAYTPRDTEGEFTPSLHERFRRAEHRRCDELKQLSARLDAEVIHFVVGFLLDDFQNVACSDAVRKHRVRESITRLLRSVELEHDADNVDWVVALHLDSEVPHAHVAMSRRAV